ncbi:MAG: M48 family metallopeptidase [Gammaproteobacteria bacterium]|nr:M48 family metallopeptidase [Gammaproteobacteria bacterium]
MLETTIYNGRTVLPETATLFLSGPVAHVVSHKFDRRYPLDQLRVSPRIGHADRFISLPEGGQLQCPDNPLLDRLPQEGKTEGLVAWLDQRWWAALVSLVLTVSGLLAGYFVGLPLAAERVSERIPMEYEQTIGEQSLSWMDSQKLFLPSQLQPEIQQTLEEGFARLHAGLPQDDYYRLEFRQSPATGPNAFALPGGIIVITDEMIINTNSPGEALAVLAHEIGHVELRHALRHVLQNSAVATVAATLTGDVSTLTLAVSGLPVLLAQAKYSREFELEADNYAYNLLKQHDLSPELFASLMERLSEKRPLNDKSWSFISSHPVTEDRIARARAAARE